MATDARQWQAAAITIRNHRSDIIQFEERSIRPYLGLFVIAFFVLIGNQANQKAIAESSYHPSLSVDIQPEVIHAVLATIDPLTPEFEEQPAIVASMFISDDQGYLSRPAAADMNQAEQLSKKDLIPYTVKQGDTLTTIAQAHGRSVATILEANNIKPEDASKITIGTDLRIPQEDTSSSLAWLDAENKAKQEAADARAKILAEAARRRSRLGVSRALAAAPDSKEQAESGFTGSASTVNSFVLPIRYTMIARGVGRGHMGIDYDANTGTAVRAAAAGRVIEITHGWAGGFGNSILVDHGGGLTTRYAHLSRSQVGIGESVGKGEQIALSGNTGNSTGPHLHFETRINGRVVSPF